MSAYTCECLDSLLISYYIIIIYNNKWMTEIVKREVVRKKQSI